MTGLNDVPLGDNKKPMPAFPLDDEVQEAIFGQSSGKLFDITQVIGSVYAGESAISPRSAAFLIISEAGEGTFTFPNENGTTCQVTVNHEEIS